MIFEVARVIHEGDVVFGVRSTNQNAEGQPTQPLSNHNIDWGQVEDDIEDANRPERVPEVPDPCEGQRYVAITKPNNNELISRPIAETSPPTVGVTAHAKTKLNPGYTTCSPPEKGYCHYQWSYREAESGGNWASYGYGQIVTIPLEQNVVDGTQYELRVEAFDSGGNHKSTDKITVTIQARSG
ncbi:MAG: hypothetical protein BRD23_09805 [Halobacteriales archaeon SW_9_67_25]|nr:MAG: hypothetical protein BRD23_09805 [Halobacteriales archaeon SW_9_67_25]